MISRFVREQRRYTQRELCQLFAASEAETTSLIRRLKAFGVLKTVRATDAQRDMSDLLEDDIEIADVAAGEDEYLYVFPFVGVIVVASRVLKCYPKYLLTEDAPKDELLQVLKVLERYNAKEQIVRMFYDSSESSAFNLLAVLLFLLQDYYENGVYSNTEDVIERNGPGEILWDKTINETFALLSGNRPYYTDLQTKRRVADDFDYFRRLHACILTRASEELRDADLLDLFELTEVDLTDEQLWEFGDTDDILYRVEQELHTQFNTRKQLVLKTIYAYIGHGGSLSDLDCLSLFGTSSFHLVWEAVCSEIMDNKLHERLGSLQLPVPLNPAYDPSQRLLDIIEKPLWTATGQTANSTLIPDLISIADNQFLIFDAKYYLAQLTYGCPPTGQPGIESVTKQYLYQLAYQTFIAEHGFSGIRNCFLMPTEGNEIEDRGEVSLDMLSSLGLQNIHVRLLPAAMAYDHYLSGRKLDIRELGL